MHIAREKTINRTEDIRTEEVGKYVISGGKFYSGTKRKSDSFLCAAGMAKCRSSDACVHRKSVASERSDGEGGVEGMSSSSRR